MIRRNDEYKIDVREQMRGGNGTVKIENFVSAAEMNDKGRLLGKIILEPGSSIGYHIHEHDAEIFHIIKGIAQYTDGDKTVTVNAGDTMVCPTGTGHSIANEGDETVELIAVIVYE
ncbi:MAG: cupin domain-containing protein [Clostridia bacterium]|nr:cupin domain-containing protein [Clostridia bacterium]